MSVKKSLSMILVDDEIEILHTLRTDIIKLFGDDIEVEVCESGSEALQLLSDLEEDGHLIPVVVSDYMMPKMNGIEFLRALDQLDSENATYRILLSGQADYNTVKEALNENLVDRCLAKPWKQDELYRVLKDLLSEFLLTHAFDQVEFYENYVSHAHYRKALVQKESQRATLAKNLWTLQQSLIAPGKFSDTELHTQLVGELESIDKKHSLGEVFQTYPDGHILFDEGEKLEAMNLVLEGEVIHSKQQLREVGLDEVMTEGLGAILGSMAHFSGNRSFTRATAKGDVRVVHLSQKILEIAMSESFSFTIYFTNILLRQVMRRVRLNVSTSVQLAETLEELKAAQLQLVESEKLATLGQLVAGVAHELNNPSAAIIRSVDHLGESVDDIIQKTSENRPENQMARQLFQEGFQITPVSTRDMRQHAKNLQQLTGDNITARNLAEMGYKDQHDVLPLEKTFGTYNKAVSFLSGFYHSGKFLRNISNCARRVESLVKSLKNYARPESQKAEPCDVREGIEETTLILQNRIKRIDLHTDYSEVPLLSARPSELNQVWTNILTNALDAIENSKDPKIIIKVSATDQDVIVTFTDNGTGIPKDKIARIFELNFTTKKHGHFGLGLGLPICKKIVQKHHGTIAVESVPGESTTFTIKLPIAGGVL